METSVGFEPTSTCFADKRLSPLGHEVYLVPSRGLEPPSLGLKGPRSCPLSYDGARKVWCG